MCYIEILDKQNIKINYKNHLVEKSDSSCLNNKFIENILLNEILINNHIYHFIGYSNSQLRDRSYYLYNDLIEQIQKIINHNGDFDKIKNINKRAARIGLLFSSCTSTIHIQSDYIIQIDGIEQNGYKDVLMINNDKIIQVRRSMKKFTSTISTCLYVCNDRYSTPKLSFIIKQLIMLLSDLNIQDENDLLKSDEVYFRPTFNRRQFMIDSNICFVAKSSSYYLGDIRILKLTSYQQLEHFI